MQGQHANLGAISPLLELLKYLNCKLIKLISIKLQSG